MINAVPRAKGGCSSARAMPPICSNRENPRKISVRDVLRILSASRPIDETRSSRSSKYCRSRSKLPPYRTIDSNGPELSESAVPVSVSLSAASLVCFACAIARWNISQRCRVASFLMGPIADSIFLYLFGIRFGSHVSGVLGEL
jgi:hypothetical protein